MALRTAITATAARSALGEGVRETWRALRQGTSAVAPLDGLPARAARIWNEVETDEDDPAMRILGPHGRLLDGVARSVHETAGLGRLPRERVGLFVGVGMVDAAPADLAAAALASRGEDGTLSLARFFDGAYRAIHPLWPLSMLGNVAAGQIAIDFDLRGDNLVLASDADAGLRALLEAARSIDRGGCDAAIAGGVSGRIRAPVLARLALQGRLTHVAPGEGGAALALEGRGESDAHALGWIRGGATAFGAAADSTGPTKDAWTRAVQGALDDSEIEAGTVDLVFRHAEGTPSADIAESGALADLGLEPARAEVHATKAGVGHLGAGAPVLDAALALEAMGQCRAHFAIILAGGAHGGAGALVLEGAA